MNAPQTPSYEEALAYLGQIRRTGVKLGLKNMQTLAARMGNLEKDLKFIHIAGTNGKGSTAAFCAQCLQEAGYKVGLFTSPHLIALEERIQINREPLPSEKLTEGLGLLRSITETMAEEGEENAPSFFEIMTALALWYFHQEKVDWVVWETGLGGRLDSTNIVTPEVCVITNVSFEHTAILGSTLEKIAEEKAGIIKPGVPIITSAEQPEVLAVILNRADQKGAPLTILSENQCSDLGMTNGQQKALLENKTYTLGLAGPHQVQNAACARGALQILQQRKKCELKEEEIARGLKNAFWTGRFQLVQNDPPWVVDGAHNLAGIEQLVQTWRAAYGSLKYNLVCGFLIDKDPQTILKLLLPQAAQLTFVGVASDRSLTQEALEKLLPERAQVFPRLQDAWSPFLSRRNLRLR